MSSRAKPTHDLGGPMLRQEKISGSDALLKLYISIDKNLKWSCSKSVVFLYDHRA